MLRIDSHHHLWDQSIRPQSWMDDATRDQIGGPYTLADWSAHAQPAGVRYGVFVQTVADPAETPEVLALAAGSPELAAVVGWIDIEGDARSAGEQLDVLLAGPGGQRLAGVRVAAEYSPDPDWLDTARVHELAAALRERDLTLDLLMSPANLAAARRLAAAHPGTRMVINHLAKPTMALADFAPWAEAIAEFAPLTHVALKLSGFLTYDAEPMTADRLAPYARVAHDTFGPDRMMFGSDWPVSVLGGGFERVVEVAAATIRELSDAEQLRVWSGTARAWYPALERTISGQ